MIRNILYAAIIGAIVGYLGMGFVKYNATQGKLAYIEFRDVNPFLNSKINDIYVITDTISNKSNFFKVIWNSYQPIPGKTTNVDDVKIAVANGKSVLKEEISADWVYNAYKDDTLFVDTLQIIYLQQLREFLINDSHKILKVYSQLNTLEIAPFRKIIQAPGGAFLVVILSFILIWFFTDTIYFMGEEAYNLPKFISLTLLIYLNSYLFENHYYTYNFLYSILFSSLTIIPAYLLYQFINERFLRNKTIGTREFFKFLLFLSSTITFQVLAFIIITYLYHSFVSPPNSSMNMSQIYWLLFNSISFWWLCIAIGNILNNLRAYSMQLQKKEKELTFTKQKELQSQAELDALQARVNPHFLYNSLNSIAGLAQEDPAKTEEMAIALSHFFKYSTNRQTENWSTVEKEIEILETYLGIEKIRFGERLQFTLTCPDDLLMHKMPRFLLQPLVENAIKYGYNQATNSIDIELVISQENQQLHFQLFDGGVPFPDNMPSGYGLQSIRKKLALLYPEKHELAFINVPKKQVAITLLISKG